MTQVFVDDLPHEVESAQETWGELLASLEERAAKTGVVLSEARFDGVEEPSFRHPATVARPLTGIGRVDIRTAVPAAFLRECLLETITSLQETACAASRLAAVFRGHDLVPGHDGMRSLASDLGDIATLAELLRGPLAIDLTALSAEGVTAAEQLVQFEATVDAVVEAQEAGDWLTVADVLEYDLEPSIRRWCALLTVLTSRLS
jgi:hypothetical protein